MVVWLGGVAVERLPGFESREIPPFVSYPLTVFFLLGTTNATNLSDGLDGLAAGLSLLSLACIASLADLAEGDELVFTSLAIIGATLGFLRYNTHPAMVFMGDTGSQFLGFSLGVLVLMLTEQVNTALTPGLALPILGLPIIDTLMVMTQRMAEGRSPFKPDKSHFHHKLLALGFDQYEAVLAIYAVQSLFVVSAYLFRYESYWLIAALYLALSAAVVLFYPLARKFGWRLHGGTSPVTGFLKRARPGETGRNPESSIEPAHYRISDHGVRGSQGTGVRYPLLRSRQYDGLAGRPRIATASGQMDRAVRDLCLRHPGDLFD